jgi:glycosyltransferase involved in cell wall biosynthesis
MSVPYASVILPTLNRHATLPFALASVQAQSEASLEIIVVLDGATSACRDVAFSSARSDPRIVVRDLPKAPRGGELNTHLAVSGARADRIFYIDDDDLWLPIHVEEIGSRLDEADIVDSRVCSADRAGRLHLTPCRASNERIRRLHADQLFKTLYDTHIAHCRAAYGVYSHWGTREGGDPVAAFLAGFSADPRCRWVSCDDVTALSLHGACRRDMDAAARRQEIETWAAAIAAGNLLEVKLSEADSLFHLFRLLWAEPPGEEAFHSYLSARGGYVSQADQLEHDLYRLVQGLAIPEQAAVNLAVRLAEPVESGYLFECVACSFYDAFGQVEAEALLRAACKGPGAALAGCHAAYSALLSRVDVGLAMSAIESAQSLGPDPLGTLETWCQKLRERDTTVPKPLTLSGLPRRPRWRRRP